MHDLLGTLRQFLELKPGPGKIANYLLNKLSRLLAAERSLGMPCYVFVEITNACNLQCKLCPTGNSSLLRNKARMAFADFKKIIDKMKRHLIKVGLGGFGEPFLNGDIYKMLEYIKEKGFFAEVYTNLLCLDKEGLRKLVEYQVDKLVVSLDAPNEDLYLRYKGADGFRAVAANLECLSEVKKQMGRNKPLIDLQFIIIKDNAALVNDIKRLAVRLKADILSLKTPNLYLGNADNYPDLKSEGHFLSADFNRYGFRHSALLPCPWVWDRLNIYADGNVVPCCYDAQGDYVFGNIFLEDTGDIWNNAGYREFRRGTANNVNSYRLCAACMERRKGAKVKVEYPVNKFRF